MRINRYIASSTGISRRQADSLVASAKVKIDGLVASAGQDVTDNQLVTVDGKAVSLPSKQTTILFNKPVGYVVSRRGQGSKTIYDLLPSQYQNLKPIGRLDKDSSGLLLLTDDGELAQSLSHPSFEKHKTYDISLDKPLLPLHQQMISDQGLQLADGPSKLNLQKLDDRGLSFLVVMHEGRNRQIRRTFEAVGYEVVKLHRLTFGNFKLDNLASGRYKEYQ